MKKLFRRITALLSAAALVLLLTPAASASAALGSELRGQTSPVAPGVTVTDQTLWSETHSDLRTEHYLTYTPNAQVRPVVSWGDYLTSRQTLESMAGALESRGLRVAGGINASFYESNGCPIGTVISNGRLQSANPDYSTVGFLADGSAVIGRPEIDISADWVIPDRIGLDEEGREVFVLGGSRRVDISGFNKIRSAGGYYLISGAYAETTKNTLDGVDVVLSPLEAADGLPLGGSVACQVTQVRGSLEDNSIPAGCFVLSMNSASDPALLAVLSELRPGDTVTIRVEMDQPWTQVSEAVSGLYDLLVDGRPGSELPNEGRAPRTAVGLRPDGSLILYTIDGRRSGYSIGATYADTASRLLELGCTDAVVMDGGGSTSLGVTRAGSDRFEMVNRSSDASPRRVSTGLFLTVSDRATGVPGGFSVTAPEDTVLAGVPVPLQVSAYDTAFRAMGWNGPLTWTARYGSVVPDGEGGWLYTGPVTESNYFDLVTVTGGGFTGSLRLTVVSLPTGLGIWNKADGAAVSELTVKTGTVVELSAAGEYFLRPLWDGGANYQWTVTPELGEIDETGRFTAGERDAAGEITVSAGAASVTIPVTVEASFVDISDSWARRYIDRLYELGITEGTTDAEGARWFYPGRTITRGELLTMIVRMLGVDTAQFDAVELPFADSGEIAGWAAPYVRAAYALELLSGAERDGLRYADAGTDITRQEAMTMIGRTLGFALETDLSVFPDGDKVSGWASGCVQTLVALGIVEGSGGQLNPGAAITRGEIAKIISQVAALPAQIPAPPAEQEPVPTEQTPMPAEQEPALP